MKRLVDACKELLDAPSSDLNFRMNKIAEIVVQADKAELHVIHSKPPEKPKVCQIADDFIHLVTNDLHHTVCGKEISTLRIALSREKVTCPECKGE